MAFYALCNAIWESALLAVYMCCIVFTSAAMNRRFIRPASSGRRAACISLCCIVSIFVCRFLAFKGSGIATLWNAVALDILESLLSSIFALEGEKKNLLLNLYKWDTLICWRFRTAVFISRFVDGCFSFLHKDTAHKTRQVFRSYSRCQVARGQRVSALRF